LSHPHVNFVQASVISKLQSRNVYIMDHSVGLVL